MDYNYNRGEIMFDILKQIYLFANLSEDELEKIMSVTEIKTFKQDEVLFREGDAADALYIIADGRVRMSKQVANIGEEALSILQPGEFFGEMGLLDDSPRSADAIIHEDSKLLEIKRSKFLEFMADNYEIGYKILLTFSMTLCERLRETNDKISNLFTIAKMF